jgi:hypothetical protein
MQAQPESCRRDASDRQVWLLHSFGGLRRQIRAVPNTSEPCPGNMHVILVHVNFRTEQMLALKHMNTPNERT